MGASHRARRSSNEATLLPTRMVVVGGTMHLSVCDAVIEAFRLSARNCYYAKPSATSLPKSCQRTSNSGLSGREIRPRQLEIYRSRPVPTFVRRRAMQIAKAAPDYEADNPRGDARRMQFT